MEKKLQKAIILEVVVYLPEEKKKKIKKQHMHLFIHSLSYTSIHNFSLLPLSNLGEQALKELSILSRH